MKGKKTNVSRIKRDYSGRNIQPVYKKEGLPKLHPARQMAHLIATSTVNSRRTVNYGTRRGNIFVGVSICPS